MIIRDMQQQDIASFCLAIGKVAAEQRFILTTEIPSVDKMTEWVNSYIDQPHAHSIAEDNGAIVGWADIIPLKRQSLSHVGNLGMGVISGYRGQGLGQRLMSSVLEKAWAIGLERIQLEVFSDNETALRLYRKHGFDTEGVKRKACFMNDRYLDIICMALLTENLR
jgi:L-amino acid N-acyltransferase YncA